MSLPQAFTPALVSLLRDAFRYLKVAFPHFTGLAYALEILPTSKVETAAISERGRLYLNPAWFETLSPQEAMFVLAHEMMHLTLRHHKRTDQTLPPLLSNLAQDAVINDLLCDELGLSQPPCGGFHIPEARHLSMEQILASLKASSSLPSRSWSSSATRERSSSGPSSSLAEKLRSALRPPSSPSSASTEGPSSSLTPFADAPFLWDLLSEELEDKMFPEISSSSSLQSGDKPSRLPCVCLRDLFPLSSGSSGLSSSERTPARPPPSIREFAEASLRLAILAKRVATLPHLQGATDGKEGFLVDAFQTSYQPPWEFALQRWMESVKPGPRSFLRPSRRGTNVSDVVLPGRKREGWTLNIILDTSGSMTNVMPYALGVIASFCSSVDVDDVRLIQCDTDVSKDERVSPEDLRKYPLYGFGGSDMTPAMDHLALDPEIESAIVLTDGYIDYPREPMPYSVLWVCTESSHSFQPPYGLVLFLPFHLPP